MPKTSLKKTVTAGLVSLALFGAIQANSTSADEGSAGDLADVIATRSVPTTTPDKDFGEPDSTFVPSPTEVILPDVAAVSSGYTFVPITPFRTFDSRSYIDGFMLGGDEIYFDVLTDQNNIPKIPSNAMAVTYNLTVTSTGGSGYLAIYPGNTTWPGNSSINWTLTGQTLANGGTVAVGYFDAIGQIRILCGPLGFLGTDFLLDITGYFI